MTVVNLKNVRNAYGIRLFKDAILSSQIEVVEFATPTDISFKAPTLQGIRVAAVYELVTGFWVERTDLRVSGDNLLLDSVPVGQLMIVPKTSVSMLQTGTKESSPVQLFIKTFPLFITENLTITTYDTETAQAGPFEFSLTEAGVYAASLVSAVIPASVWIRSKTTVVGESKTIPIIVTADIYL